MRRCQHRVSRDPAEDSMQEDQESEAFAAVDLRTSTRSDVSRLYIVVLRHRVLFKVVGKTNHAEGVVGVCVFAAAPGGLDDRLWSAESLKWLHGTYCELDRAMRLVEKDKGRRERGISREE